MGPVAQPLSIPRLHTGIRRDSSFGEWKRHRLKDTLWALAPCRHVCANPTHLGCTHTEADCNKRIWVQFSHLGEIPGQPRKHGQVPMPMWALDVGLWVTSLCRLTQTCICSGLIVQCSWAASCWLTQPSQPHDSVNALPTSFHDPDTATPKFTHGVPSSCWPSSESDAWG